MRAELAGNAGSDGEVLLRSRPITLKDARAWVNLVAIILITEMASGLRMCSG
jgi:hypothetical protein